jgi:hypothetical protein
MSFIFMLSGIASLNLSSAVTIEHEQVTLSIKNQYEVESTLNQVMWAINNTDVDPSQLNYGSVETTMDSTTQELTVELERYAEVRSTTVTLEQVTPFDYTIATREGVHYNHYSVYTDDEAQTFEELPIPDLNYLLSRAVKIHSQSFHTYKNLNLKDGIHIFTGHHLTFENIEHNGTLVFLGRQISFEGDLIVDALGKTVEDEDDNRGKKGKGGNGKRGNGNGNGWGNGNGNNNDDEIAEPETVLPALIFTNPREDIHLYREDVRDRIAVNGAVVVAGDLTLSDGTFSGPFIANYLEFRTNMDLLDQDSHFRGKWHEGFGDAQDYTWPNRGHRETRKVSRYND